MKKIINGKKYDTDTAEFVGRYWNGRGATDFTYFEEALFKKKTGEFFLEGEGGALTAYAVPCGSGCSGGCKIIPLTEKEARDWVEKNLSYDTFVEFFGEPEE